MVPNTKIFVGSLPQGTKPEELRRLFQNFGVVTECDIMNRCGFVHMENPEMVNNAIKALNNTNFKGQKIAVEPGRMKDRNTANGNASGRQQGNSNERPGNMGNRGGPNSNQGRNFGNRGRDQRGGRGVGQRNGGRNFGNQGNMRNNNNGGGGGSGVGPMRRDRGLQQQRNNGPYNKNMGNNNSGNFDQRWQVGNGGGMSGNNNGNRNYDDNGPQNYNNSPIGGNLQIGSLFGNDRFNGGGSNFGMGNQDRRGFALPENSSMFGNNMNSSGFGNNQGGHGDSYGGNQKEVFSAKQREMFGNNQGEIFSNNHRELFNNSHREMFGNNQREMFGNNQGNRFNNQGNNDRGNFGGGGGNQARNNGGNNQGYNNNNGRSGPIDDGRNCNSNEIFSRRPNKNFNIDGLNANVQFNGHNGGDDNANKFSPRNSNFNQSFPPLGAGNNRNRGPRQNNMMSNRRF